MNETFKKLEDSCLEKGQALKAAGILFDWDNATIQPEEAGDLTSKIVGSLSEMEFNTYINDEVRQLMKKLEKEKDTLDRREKAILKELECLYDRMETIPSKEYREFSELCATAVNKWAKAKETGKFEEFAPILKKILDYKKKFAGYRKKEGDKRSSYDIMLSDFEPCFGTKEMDDFFDTLKKELVPLIKEITKKAENTDKNYNYKKYDIEKQKELAKYLAAYIGFDFEKGVMAESAHPFTTNLHNRDVRITNHYHEDNLESGIFSIIHEAGHALYEMQVDDSLTLTLAGEGSSMGLHESQSRFFENIIGRSKAFWKPLFGKLKETFPDQLKEVTLEQFIKGINKPQCSLIRTEADELTYSMHILIRYEVERMLFEEEIQTEDIPKVWNEKYEKYLGVKPESDKEGALQDVHWSMGEFGYFPSYALGSAIGAQIYYHMKENMPLEKYLEEGNLKPIREFLKEHIHKYGKSKNTNEILKEMTGEEFNPKYFIDYLREKYENLYS